MPKGRKVSVTELQKAEIARFKLEGKTSRQIAKQTGLALSTVSHAAQRYPEVRAILEEAARNERKNLLDGWRENVASIRDDIKNAIDPKDRREAGRDLMEVIRIADRACGFMAAEDNPPPHLIPGGQQHVTLGVLVDIARQAKPEGE